MITMDSRRVLGTPEVEKLTIQEVHG